jgi:hypothetical protein
LPSFAVLQLDTHAPVVTWGAVEDAEADFELKVGYTLNEPGITSAEIRLGDGRVLPMDVQPTFLSVQLPADTPNGATVVRAYVQDDVLNSALRTLVIQVVGVEAPPPPAPTGIPSRLRPVPRRIVEPVSTCRGSSDDVVRAIIPTLSVVRGRSRYLAPTVRTVRHMSRVRGTAAPDAVFVTAVTLAGRGAGSSADVIWRRPEGPRAEDDLIVILDL